MLTIERKGQRCTNNFLRSLYIARIDACRAEHLNSQELISIRFVALKTTRDRLHLILTFSFWSIFSSIGVLIFVALILIIQPDYTVRENSSPYCQPRITGPEKISVLLDTADRMLVSYGSSNTTAGAVRRRYDHSPRSLFKNEKKRKTNGTDLYAGIECRWITRRRGTLIRN